ncbi:hypothetical protein [Ensifer canadensis]
MDISHTLDLTAVLDHVAPERRAQAKAVLAEFERALPAITNLKRLADHPQRLQPAQCLARSGRTHRMSSASSISATWSMRH